MYKHNINRLVCILTQPKLKLLHQNTFKNAMTGTCHYHFLKSSSRVYQVLFISLMEGHQVLPSSYVFDCEEEFLYEFFY